MYSPNVTKKVALDALTLTANFSQVSLSSDGTLPTDEAGNIGHFNAPTTLTVDFGMREISAYTVSVGFSATGHNFVGTQQVTSVPFSGPGADFALDVTCSPGCSTSSGVGWSNAVFVGTNASHVINSFQMKTDDGLNTAVGTVHLKRP